MADLFAHPSFDDLEQVLFVSDPSSGLNGIIVDHNTRLSPACGGCRMYPCASTQEALPDVLRLSRGITLKNAAAGLPLAGGKCVIIADLAQPASAICCTRWRSMGSTDLKGVRVAVQGMGKTDTDLIAQLSEAGHHGRDLHIRCRCVSALR